jgi:hypothetical protein
MSSGDFEADYLVIVRHERIYRYLSFHDTYSYAVEVKFKAFEEDCCNTGT